MSSETISADKKFKPIIVPVYNYWVFAIMGRVDLKEFMEEWEVELDETEFEGAKALCFKMTFVEGEYKGKEFNILYFDPNYFSVGVIVHECVHSVHDMMKSRGIPVNYKNTEVMAYSTEYLFDEVLKEFAK